MTAVDIISELEQIGLHLWEDEGRLRFRGPEGSMTPERRERLASQKENVLRALREREREHVQPDPDAMYEPFPLTEVQSAYLLGRRGAFEYGSVPCHAYGELEFESLDQVRLQLAWETVVARHEMLRATIDYDGHQRVLADPPAPVVTWHDETQTDDAAAARALGEVRDRLSHESKDVTGCPLYTLEVTELSDRAVLHFSIDFLIADYVSIYRLLDELGAFYENPRADLPAPSITFRDYLRAERAVRQGPAYERDRDYWLARLDDLPPAPELPMVARPSRHGAATFTRRQLTLEPATWTALKEQAGRHGISASTAVMAAYAEVIGRWSRNPRFTLDVTVLSRLPLHPDVHDLVGDFTSVELLALDTTCADTFAGRARVAGEQLFDDLDHRLFSGVEVLRELTRRRGAQGSMMPVVFTSAIGLSGGIDPRGPMRSEIHHGISQTPQVWVDCQAMEADGALLVNWDVRDDVIPEPVLDDMFEAFRVLLHDLSGTDGAWTGDPVGLPGHQTSRREAANDTARPISDALLHEAWVEHAVAHPDEPAVRSSTETISHRRLLGRAAAAARALREAGHQPHQRVGVVLEKGWEQLAAVLGVLLSGGTYVPIESSQPDARRHRILDAAGIDLVLSHSEVQAQLPSGRTRIDLDHLGEVAELPDLEPVSPRDSAYVIFTSGSTGEPKGVEISHAAAVNTLDDVCRRFGVQSTDVALGLSSLGFDLSVFDVFGVLGRGGTLVMPDADRRSDPSHWGALIVEHGVTVLNTVPAQMMLLEEYLASGGTDCSSVRLGMMSGDWIPVTLPDAIRAHIPDIELVSLGGATEAAIWSIHYPIGEVDPTWTSIPYGVPLENQRFHVLDSDLRPNPDLVVGDLFIVGDGLAQGYLGDPEKTAHSFITLPTGERAYRTGDLGRYLSDGNIEFVGRDDRQVKIRGHRVELAEVESALGADPEVGAVAVTTQGERNDRRLVAFVETATTPARTTDPAITPEVVAAGDEIRSGVDVAKVVEFAQVLDDAALRRMIDVLRQEGVWPTTQDRHTTAEIMRIARVAPKHERLVRRWLGACADNDYLVKDEQGGFTCPRLVSPEDVAAAWQEVERLLPHAHDRSELVEYFRLASDHLPQLMRDEQDPLQLLFPEGDLSIQEAAYMEGFLSHYLNRLATSTVLGVARRNTSGKPLRVLEVGAGVGGTSVDTIPALDGEGVRYRFTDVSQFFLNKASERFADYSWVDYAMFDFNEPFREQGVNPNSVDVILCGNVMHYSKDARSVLRRMREALAPGGWLVFIETTRDNYQILTSMEFLFDATAGDFQDVRHGRDQTFIARDEWYDLLGDADADLEFCLPGADDALADIGMHVFAARFKTERAAIDVDALTERLAERLPAEMIPSRIELLDALPLTSNGKVDRSVLTTWAEQRTGLAETAGGGGSRGASELEGRIAAVYGEVLHEPDISLEANFYALGGDSLLAAQVVTSLRDNLPEAAEVFFDELLRELLGGASVRELASYLGNDRPAEEGRDESGDVVLAGATGEIGNPVHVVVSDGFAGHAERIAEGLGRRDPVVVVPAVVIDAHADVRIEDLAHQVVEQVRALAPGPFHVVGAHTGGVLAAAVAQQLTELDVPVCGLSVVSSYPLPAVVEDPVLAEALFLLGSDVPPHELGYPDPDQLGALLGALAPAGAITAADVAGLAHGSDPLLSAAARVVTGLTATPDRARLDAIAARLGEPTDDVERRIATTRALADAAATHDPGIYAGEARLLVHTEGSPVWPDLATDMESYWERVCIGGLSIERIPGDHFTCRAQVSPDAVDLPEEDA